MSAETVSSNRPKEESLCSFEETEEDVKMVFLPSPPPGPPPASPPLASTAKRPKFSLSREEPCESHTSSKYPAHDIRQLSVDQEITRHSSSFFSSSFFFFFL
jgi:hypothetical protein